MSTNAEPGLGQRCLWNPPYTRLLGLRENKVEATAVATHDPSDVRHGEHRCSLGTQESSACSSSRTVGMLVLRAAEQHMTQHSLETPGSCSSACAHELIDWFDSHMHGLREFRPRNTCDADTAPDSVRRTDQTGFRSQPLPFHTVLSSVSWLPSSGIWWWCRPTIRRAPFTALASVSTAAI